MTSTNAISGSPEERWPSVDQAYEFVLPAYETVHRRLDAVNGHIQTLQAFAATITVAASILASSIAKHVDFDSGWFLAAMVAFIGIVVGGAFVREWGSLQVISLTRLYDEWLHYTPWEFKKNMIYWAGQADESNRGMVNKKGMATLLITAAFALEVALLVGWVLTER